jgi:hypothetical protein
MPFQTLSKVYTVAPNYPEIPDGCRMLWVYGNSDNRLVWRQHRHRVRPRQHFDARP